MVAGGKKTFRIWWGEADVRLYWCHTPGTRAVNVWVFRAELCALLHGHDIFPLQFLLQPNACVCVCAEFSPFISAKIVRGFPLIFHIYFWCDVLSFAFVCVDFKFCFSCPNKLPFSPTRLPRGISCPSHVYARVASLLATWENVVDYFQSVLVC